MKPVETLKEELFYAAHRVLLAAVAATRADMRELHERLVAQYSALYQEWQVLAEVAEVERLEWAADFQSRVFGAVGDDE